MPVWSRWRPDATRYEPPRLSCAPSPAWLTWVFEARELRAKAERRLVHVCAGGEINPGRHDQHAVRRGILLDNARQAGALAQYNTQGDIGKTARRGVIALAQNGVNARRHVDGGDMVGCALTGLKAHGKRLAVL